MSAQWTGAQSTLHVRGASLGRTAAVASESKVMKTFFWRVKPLSSEARSEIVPQDEKNWLSAWAPNHKISIAWRTAVV